MHAPKTSAPRTKAGCGCGSCASCATRGQPASPEAPGARGPATRGAAPEIRDRGPRSSSFGYANPSAPATAFRFANDAGFRGSPDGDFGKDAVGSSRVDLQACKLEYSIVSPK